MAPAFLPACIVLLANRLHFWFSHPCDLLGVYRSQGWRPAQSTACSSFPCACLRSAKSLFIGLALSWPLSGKNLPCQWRQFSIFCLLHCRILARQDWMAVAVVKDTTPDPIPAKEVGRVRPQAILHNVNVTSRQYRP